ncbi:MAG: RluA family pseudouridine synthase [Miltoncostaeaceae bacterium]
MTDNPADVLARVERDDDGRRLDTFVGGLTEVGSRAEAQRLIEAGRVLVDGHRRPKRYSLSEGETLRVRPSPPPRSDLTPEHVPLEVVHEDEHLLVVDKPAGVVTHPSAGHESGTLVHGLLDRAIAGGDDPTRPGIVHRLDRDTSGLLVVARSPRAHRRLQAALRRREVERRYIALVHGRPPPAVTIDRPIARDPRSRRKMTSRMGTGREAVTHLRLDEQIGDFALVRARLETGRTHQIRVHLEAEGLPVAGDPVYGARGDPLRVGRQFLHAASLAFPHPETGQRIEAQSPLPGDLDAALGRARRLADEA